MSSRRAKQLIYGVFYGIVWVVVFYTGYWVFVHPFAPPPPPPPCGDFCAPPGVKPISAQGGVSVFTTSPGHYTFLSQLANLNSNFAAATFDYTFTAYDVSGAAIATFPGQSFIYASEIKYVVAPNVAVPDSFDHVGITVTNVKWVDGALLGIVPQFAFQNMQVGVTSSTISVGGEIANKDIITFKRVLVIAVWKGPQGDPVGASATEVDDLEAGTTQTFSVIYPAIAGVNPADNQVFAYALKGE